MPLLYTIGKLTVGNAMILGWRPHVEGIENIPATGGALVVANHSGTIPLDSLMTQLAVHDEHPGHRLRVRLADRSLRHEMEPDPTSKLYISPQRIDELSENFGNSVHQTRSGL